jgi:endonuclease/exonuclease/phosphatase family metal-dependent hydrolase
MSTTTKAQRFVMAVILAFFSNAAFAQEMPENLMAQSSVMEFRLMSYNVNGLPWPLKANKAPLFKEMARIFQEQRGRGVAPQVLVLQEGFRGDVKHFVENAGYKFIVKGPNSKVRREGEDSSKALTNSGLYILSDYPIVQTDYVVFGSNCSGWDCYANKGVLYAQIEVPGIGLVDIFDTHLNSVGSSGTKEDKVWAAQLQQMKITSDFINSKMSTTRVALFGGDFNIKDTSPIYNHMLNAMLPLFNAGQFCKFYPKNCELGEGTLLEELLTTTDHQYYKAGGGVNVFPSYAEKNMKLRLGDRDLSDHPGLIVKYKFYK